MHLHDLQLGARVRQRRHELGMTQAALATALHLTFQQIQKYENGINRIAASTLIEIARTLKTPVAWFFEDNAASAVQSPPATSARMISAIDGLASMVSDLVRANLIQVQVNFASTALGDLPLAVYLIDRDGLLMYCNAAAADFAGRQPRIGQDMWCVTWRLWEPDGRRLPHDRCPMAIAMKEDRAVRGASAVAERPDGSRASFTPYPTPLHDSHGALVGGFNALAPLAA